MTGLLRSVSEVLLPGSTTDVVVMFELVAVFAVLLAALLFPGVGRRRLASLEGAFKSIAGNRAMVLLLPVFLAVGLRVALLLLLPVPQPIIHDEFCHLLAADTFVHGRLTNPTHPMWVHFEAMHVNMKPTTMSKYPPVQGLILALGRVLGHPWIGVLLSMGVLCGAVSWMLAGWFSPPWALLGGCLAAVRYGVTGYWMNSYWGGAGAAIGGALVAGALPRLKTHVRARDAFLFAGGLAILANSRPFEGLLFSLPLCVVLLVWLLGKNGPAFPVTVRRVLLPVGAVMLPALLWIGYYDFRTTGSVWSMPSASHQATYGIAPLFFWQSPGPPRLYNHRVLRNYFEKKDPEAYLLSRTSLGLGKLMLAKLRNIRLFYFGPLLLVAILPVLWHLRDPRLLVFALGGLGVALGSIAVPLQGFPHYIAPFFGPCLGIAVLGITYLRQWSPGARPAGLFLARMLPLICVASLAACLVVEQFGLKPFAGSPPMWCCTSPGNVDRAYLLEKLNCTPDKHMVIVRWEDPGVDHDPWVYNEADIDNAKVVWAREMEGGRTAELLDYFRDRRIWLLRPNADPRSLRPYTTETGGAGRGQSAGF